MSTDVRPNYFNLQTLDVQDLQQEHEYLQTRLEEGISTLSLQGVTDVNGLQVFEDSVVAEPFAIPTVTQDETRPDLKNFLDFPFDEVRTKSARAYSVFKAEANNIQRIDLRIQINAITNTSFVAISLVSLQNPLSPTSELGSDVLTRRVYRPDDLPTLDQTNPLVLDFSGDNDRAGISVTPGNYYAIVIEFTRETASQDVLRVFHSNRAETASVDSELHSWVYFGTRFQQGLFTQEASLETFVFYHKVYAAAVQVTPGTALVSGKPIRILETQRYLGLVDRGGDAPQNYIVMVWEEETAATESAARTGNTAVSRLRDTFEVRVLNSIQYDELVNSDDIFYTLAVVQDRNVLAFRKEQAYTIDPNSNLAYHDWLVPTNEQPSLASLNLVDQRPADLVFVADNVPLEIPLTRFDGTLALDVNGRQQVDRIVQVFLDIYLDGGNNKQSLQMYVVKETTSEPPYRTFAATLTDPDNEDLVPYSYPFDNEQLAVDTYYNFRAVTAASNEVYVQDYDRVFGNEDPVTGKFISLRSRQFETIAEKGDIVLKIDEDLKLGESAFSSGVAGQELVGYKTQYRANETATPNGVASGQSIVPITDGCDATCDYTFSPLPMVTREGVLIENTDSSIINAYDAGDITILVDGIDITFSGTQSRDKGGRGSPMTIFGEILSSDKNDYVGATVKLRNADGKDNTQQNTTYTVGVDTNGKVQFTAIALGRGPGSQAGFAQGESVYVYIDNKPALDANNVPITVTFNEFSANAVETYSFGAEKYFTGKTIVSAGEHIVAGQVQLDEGEVAIDSENGRLYFADGERPSGNVVIQYLRLDEELGRIDYYSTQQAPFGTNVATPIPNTDNAVQAAVASGDIVVAFGGRDLRQLDCTPDGPAEVVAEDPTRTLKRYQVAINPETGKIIFGIGFTEEQPLLDNNIPLLTSDTAVVVSYYHLQPQTISTVSQLFAGYQAKYDLNSDGKIDDEDVAIFNTAYGSKVGDVNYLEAADFNNDGLVDDTDKQELILHFGTSSTGNEIYDDATTARLTTLFAYERGNPTKRLKFVRALSKPETTTELGQTILFLSNETPVDQRGSYVLVFGYPNLLEDTINSFDLTTEVDFVRPIEYGSVKAYQKDDTTNTRAVVTSDTATRVQGGAVVYDHSFTFTPPIRESATWVFESNWLGSNIDVFNRRKFVSPLEYETSQRQVKGPFDIILGGDQFDPDGTFVELAIGPRDAFFADGNPDNDGRLIHGVPIEEMRFKVILRVPTDDNTNEVDEWVWHNLEVDPQTKLIRLGVNDALQESHRNKGRNGKTVLQPFGVTQEQIALKPQFANGDILNDLSNLLVFREEDANTLPDHTHDIPSDQVFVNNICGFTGVQPRLTSVLCELKRLIEQNVLIGDYGNELVLVNGCSTGYGGTQPPIRVPTQIGDVCFEACGPIASLNPSVPPNPIPNPDYYPYYYDEVCPTCDCLVQIKIGRTECGFFEIEYCVDPCFTGDVLLNFNWAACGYICECPPDEPPPPIIGEVVPFQECVYNFSANVDCGSNVEGNPAYFWDLGDGVNTSSEQSFQFEYTQPGTYKVTLVATCPDGRVFTDEVVIVVS